MRTTYYVVLRGSAPVARRDTKAAAVSERRRLQREDRAPHSVLEIDAGRPLAAGEYPSGTERERIEPALRGRPPLPNPRSVLLTLRVLPEERDRYTEAARRAGQGLSAWLRELADRAARSG